MLISKESITHLANIITGASGISVVRQFDDITKLLQKHVPCEPLDNFLSSLPTTPSSADEVEKNTLYVTHMLSKLKGSSNLTKLVEQLFNSPSFFTDNSTTPPTKYSLEENLYSFNSFMAEKDEHGIVRDNYLIKKLQKRYRVYGLNDCIVDFRFIHENDEIDNYIHINDHIRKCRKKINAGDYAGAITNARSFIEQLMREISLKINVPFNQDDNLPRAFNRFLTGLKITDDSVPQDIKTIYFQVLGGFKTTIVGLAGMRNNMSDAHCIKYPPGKKDALLAVNTVKTLANFIVEHYFEKFVEVA